MRTLTKMILLGLCLSFVSCAHNSNVRSENQFTHKSRLEFLDRMSEIESRKK